MPVSDLYSTTAPQPNASLPTGRGLRRRLLLLPGWVLPAMLTVALGGLFALVFRDRLLPAVPVRVAPVILLTDLEGEAAASGEQGAGSAAESRTLLFQAGGWLEPDPLPIHATALTDGVIRAVHVLEGQEVKKGQPLADLIDDDAKISLSAAERAHERAEAELRLQEVQVSVMEADAAAMADLVRAAEARLAEERDNQTRVVGTAAGSVSEQERARAKYVVAGQVAEVAARKSQQLAAQARVAAARAQQEVLSAAVAAAEVEVGKAKLALERTRITSPVDGVILELHAAPGQKKLLGMDNPLSATVAELFEKGRLQARVDVPLTDARGLKAGQEATVTSDFLPNHEFRGVVTRIVGAANLQRNTLQAKVRVMDPDPRLRPEMLCRVRFFGPADETAAGGGAAAPDGKRAVMVPEAAVMPETGNQARVWIVAPDGVTAATREVTLGGIKRDGYLSVSAGVLPGELVILPPHEALSPAKRVRPTPTSH